MRIFRHDCKWTSTLVTSQRHTRRLQRRRRHRAWCASELLAPAAEVCDCATMPPTHVPLSCLCSARVGEGGVVSGMLFEPQTAGFESRRPRAATCPWAHACVSGGLFCEGRTGGPRCVSGTIWLQCHAEAIPRRPSSFEMIHAFWAGGASTCWCCSWTASRQSLILYTPATP